MPGEATLAPLMPHHVESSARRTRWSITRGAPLVWKSWDDDEYVVYSPASGDSHLINRFTAEVLRQLEHSDLELPDLSSTVARSLGIELDPKTETYIARLVAYLDRIGLVEPAP